MMGAVRQILTQEQVLSQIEDTILEGGFGVGDRLPSEREFVLRLGVSRASVREAFQVLASMGILEPDGTGGPVVCGQPTEALRKLVRLRMTLSGFDVADLIGVRVQLERSAASRAATEATPADLAYLNELLTAMRRPGVPPSRFEQLDNQFHIGLAVASANALTIELMQALGGAISAEMARMFAQMTDWAATVAQLVEEHQAILTAITARAGEQAARQVSEHITNFYAQPSAS